MNKIIGIIKGDLAEIEAYRDLQNEPFDFGNGLITNDSRESEDVYYKIRQQNLRDMIEDLKESKEIENKKRVRNNRYIRKEIGKKILRKLYNRDIYGIYEKTDGETGNKYLTRVYNSGRKRIAKRLTNKRVRGARYNYSLRNGEYRKVFDYYWEVY